MQIGGDFFKVFGQTEYNELESFYECLSGPDEGQVFGFAKAQAGSVVKLGRIPEHTSWGKIGD